MVVFAAAPAAAIECEAGNGGITLPDGFCALVVADNVGRARHLAVAENGDIYVALRESEEGKGGVVALRDTDGDGRADVREQFGEHYGTGLELHGGFLYFGSNDTILRYRLEPGKLVPPGPPEIVVGGLPQQRSHAAKPIEFDANGHLYTMVGGPSNACQEDDRKKGVPGMMPCPLLEWQASVWRFDAKPAGQTQEKDGYKYATGIRHAVGLAWNHQSKGLYLVQHGRDQLSALWPEFFNDEQSAEIPAEEFLAIEEGADYLWPYCYFDPLQGKKVLAPEYGGDGKKVGNCHQAPQPLIAFPAHWAPNDILFYTGTQFPGRYRGGAFIAFHGSWNRAPLPQGGYNVVFVPMADGRPSGDWEVFAYGFAGGELGSPRDARFRPMGLSLGADGSLFISDSMVGRIWRVIHSGS